jgi:hypothetical protein
LNVDRIDSGGDRRFPLKVLTERVERLAGSLDMDGHAAFVVQDPSRKLMSMRQAIHEGTEPDTLNDARYPQLAGLRRRASHIGLPSMRSRIV